MADDKLIFPIGFDLEEGVKEASKEWKSAYQKQLQDTIDKTPLKVKLDLDNEALKALSKMSSSVKSETKKTEDAIGGLKHQLKALSDEWNKLSASQRAGVEGSRLREQYRDLTHEAKGYSSTLRSAVSAEDKATASRQRATKATDRQSNAYKTQSTYLSRLVQRMVAYASVTQVFSFLRNIRDVTAQFELQRVALGSIIGDLNEANAMFEQIKAAAVKSPFQIKELVTYTKQLAAYKIETDELFETTQRLADVSAGLGVGMERLVLAYGQIRATGYLRASEVRQLTEAGIPIVEELAKKMSDLRGETVSAAEVMGMISERAISFGMVKEVFDDMTSAGGMFYKMQEKQAETLAGQWSNLQDSISIMYEEIGNTERVNNAMKGMIGLIKKVAENWQLHTDILKITAIQYSAVFAVSLFIPRLIQSTKLLQMAEEAHARAKKLSNAATQRGSAIMAFSAKQTQLYAYWMRQAANAHTMFGRGVKKLTAMFLGGGWIGAVVSVLTIAVSWFISARKEVRRLGNELNEIDIEGALQTEHSVRDFERLARTIRESADGSKKQVEALAEMKRAYGEFLPLQDKSIISLVREKDGYHAITQAIREKVAMQIQEQKLNKIASDYGKHFGYAESEIATDEMFADFSKKEISLIIADIKNAINEGLISTANEVSDNAKKIQEIIKNITGKEVRYDAVLGRLQGGFFGYAKGLKLLIEAQEGYNYSIQEVEESMEYATGSLSKYHQAYEDFKEGLKDVTGTGEKFSFEWNESKTKNEIKAYNEFIGGLLAKEGIKFDIGEAIDFKGLYEALGNNYPQLKQVVAKIQGEYEKLVPTDITRLASIKLQEYAEKVGISMDEVKEHLKTNEQSTKDWVEGLKSSYESLEVNLAEHKKNQEAFDTQGAPFRDRSKEIGATTKELQVLKLLMDFFKEFLSDKDAKKTNPRIALLNEELSTVEKIYKEYQELRKFMSEDDARARVADMFEGVNLTMLSQALSPAEMRQQLQKALDEAKKMGDKKQILELEYKLGKFDVDEEQRKLEKNLKRLSDQISRTKTAKEFFDRMLGMTGDKELSATLTLSVYGTTGDDLKAALVKQVEGAFKGVDISGAIDYNTMTINYQKLAEIYAKNQDKILDANKSMAESIVKDGQKTSASQIEQWAKELEAVKTYADKRVDIARQTQQRISEIEASTLPEDEKQRLQEQYRKKEEKDLAKLEYQSFKESPMYVAMFDNLDSASTTMLNNMRAKLMELKEAWGGLDMPTELKEMQSRLNEIDKQLASRNPFKTLANAYKGYQELREQGSREEAEQDLIDKTARHAKEVAILNENIKEATRYQQAYDDAVAEYGKDSVQARTAEAHLYIANSVVDTQKESVNTTEEAVEASQELVNKWKELDDVVGGAWEQADMLTQAIINLGRNLADAFGGFGSDADAEFFDTLMTGFGNLASGITSIGKGIASGDPIAIINGIGSAISGLASLFTAGTVRKANKEIEWQQETLDKLNKSYEKLEKQIEKTFGSDYLKNYNDRLANLYAQQEAYLKQAEAERSKGKKEDEEKTQGYLDSASDVAEQIADMQKEVSERFSGTDLAGAARDFAQSWIDAYKEFGSTTEAMKEKFHDMIQNMVVESIAGKMMQELLRPVFEDIEKYAKDGNLDEREIADIADKSIGLIDAMDEGMTGIVERLRASGYDIRQSTSGLTGISKDIASASEESILGLAAGINTQNFYISQVPPKLDTIIALLQGGGVQVGGSVNMQDLITIQNQHLSHLPNIAQNTADTVAKCERAASACERMADQLDRVIKPRGTQATHTVNTSL